MQGPPPSEANQAVWSVSTLREYLLRVIADQDARMTQLITERDSAIHAMLTAQKDLAMAALIAQKEAVTKAEDQAREWQKASNEWRGAMNDRERDFARQTEVDRSIEALNQKMDDAVRTTNKDLELLRTWASEGYGRATATAQMWGAIAGGVGILIAIVAVVVAILK